MKTYVATGNAGKLRELKALFAKSALHLCVYRKYAGVVEDARSYVGNALLKANALAATLRERGIDAAVLADDSGVEVDALAGRPGVLSARYGGDEMGWAERRAMLLGELRGIPPFRRTARFISVLALIEPGQEPLVATGEVRGHILEGESGSGGFGYDPIFLYPAAGRSFAAMTEKEKNAVSHRRHAAVALLAMLHERA